MTQLGGELGMFIAGGFQRSGRRVRWLPLGRPGKPMVEELQMLVEPRRSQYIKHCGYSCFKNFHPKVRNQGEGPY